MEKLYPFVLICGKQMGSPQLLAIWTHFSFFPHTSPPC
jgi:hypothetical protein